MDDRQAFGMLTQEMREQDAWRPGRTEVRPGVKVEPLTDWVVVTVFADDYPPDKRRIVLLSDGSVECCAYERAFYVGGPNSGSWLYDYTLE